LDGGAKEDAAFPDAGSGPPDAATPDAALPTDSGARPDAGLPDAALPDAGPPDAGPPDAGPLDAGPPDAGPPAEVARVVFGNLADTLFFTRGYFSDGSFGATSTSLGGLSHTGSYVEIRLGPKNLDAISGAQAGAGTHFDWWNQAPGAGWSHQGFDAMGLAAGTNRGFDLEVEGISGEALMVASDDNDPTPNFRVWDGSAWSAKTPIFTTGNEPGTGWVQWVQLVADPGSDKMVLLYADANADLFALLWSGSSWEIAGVRTLETDLLTIEYQAFDGVFIPDSGDFVAAWGATGYEGIRSIHKDAGDAALPTGTTSIPLAKALPGVVRMAAAPGVNQAALVFLEVTSGMVTPGLGGAIWSPIGWVGVSRIINSVTGFNSQKGAPKVAVEMVPSSGQVVVVFDDNDTDDLEWITWSLLEGWAQQTEVDVAGLLDGIDRIEAVAIPATDEVLFLIDNGPSLYAYSYDGQAWSVPAGGDPVAPALNDDGIPVYGVGVWP
jgi:hypothetical protein